MKFKDIYLENSPFLFFYCPSFCKFVLTIIKLGLCLCLNMIFGFSSISFIYMMPL